MTVFNYPLTDFRPLIIYSPRYTETVYAARDSLCRIKLPERFDLPFDKCFPSFVNLKEFLEDCDCSEQELFPFEKTEPFYKGAEGFKTTGSCPLLPDSSVEIVIARFAKLGDASGNRELCEKGG